MKGAYRMMREHNYPRLQKQMEKMIAIMQLPKDEQDAAIERLVMDAIAAREEREASTPKS